MKNLKIIYLFALLLLASCLPQEKTTQCEDGEAFDAGKRKCVPTEGSSNSSISISNISPVSSYTLSTIDPSQTHEVTISDPFNIGFQIRWNLIAPTGGTTLLATGSSITFDHTSFPTGSYILETQLFNSEGTSIIDARSWTINIITAATPSVTQITASPFSTTTTSASTSIAATVNNPGLINDVTFQWYVNGSAIAGETGTFSTSTQALSFTFDPTSVSAYFTGANIYTVQLILTENGSGSNYDTSTWVINNSISNFANTTLGVSTIVPGVTTPSTATIITVLSGVDLITSGFRADLDAVGLLDPLDFCVQVDDIAGVDGDGVFVDFLIDGASIPLGTNQQFTINNTAVCLGDSNPNYLYTLPSNIAAESHTLTAVVYDKFTGTTGQSTYNGFNQISSLSWTLRVRQLNTAPVITIDDANTTLVCATKTTTSSYTACDITHATAFQVALSIADDDYDPLDFTGGGSGYEHFQIQFYLDSELLDGATPSDSTAVDCDLLAPQTNNASRYTCNFAINPYDPNGPLNIAGLTYSLTAKVTDTGSPYGGAAMESNIVTWDITNVNDINTAPIISAFTDIDALSSYISTDAIPGVQIGLNANVAVLTEGDIAQFHIQISEPERDSYTVKIQRCINNDCNVLSSGSVVTSTVTSTDNSNPKVIILNHTIEEDEIVALIEGNVTYRVTVTDSGGPGSLTDFEDVSFRVLNKNPLPVVSPAGFNPLLTAPLIAMSGFPITIDPGAITDASTADGDVLEYQWMYSTSGGAVDDWLPIDGATSKILIWSPDQALDFIAQTGTPMHVKLCVGDDGNDAAGDASPRTPLNATNDDCNPGAVDSSGSLAADAWEVTVFSNMAQGDAYADNNTNNTSLGELAVWVDPSSVDPIVKYMAYVNVARQIVIEKILTSADGTKAGSIEKGGDPEIEPIIFNASNDGAFATNPITNLSITGDVTGGSLYLAYMTPMSGIDSVHIRRIDISGGKTGFVHDGKFGFDGGYNDLTDNIAALTPGITIAINGASGLLEITFTSDADSIANMGVEFANLHGTTSQLRDSDAPRLSPNLAFCAAACGTTNLTAASFALALNASTEPSLQGLTALAAGSVVTLTGSADGEYSQADQGATRIGSIVVNQASGKWVLPMIDHDPALPNKNKISLLRGDLAVRIIDANMTKTLLTTTEPAVEIANDISGDNRHIIAIRRELVAPGDIEVYELSNADTIVETRTDIFLDSNITNIKVTASKETLGSAGFEPSAFITGTSAGNTLAFARIDSALGDYNLTGATGISELDSGFSLTKSLDNYDISAGTEQFQLLLAIVADPNTDGTFEAYIAQISGSSPSIDCSHDTVGAAQDETKCMKMLTLSDSVTFNLEVALGDALKDVTIGNIGATVDENKNDIIPYAFHTDDGGGVITADAVPIQGLINITGTTLSADETNAGTGYIIPYVSP